MPTNARNAARRSPPARWPGFAPPACSKWARWPIPSRTPSRKLSRRQPQAKVALVTAELAQRRHRLARVHGSLGRAPGKAAVSGANPPGRVTVRMRYTLGPLADVAKFIVGTRPIRTMEWTNVVLPK